MSYLSLLSNGFFLSLSLCLDIGIANVAIISLTLSHGFRPGFWLGLGSCFGDLIYASLALAGMAALLQFDAVRWVVWIGGTAILLILTWKMAREALDPTINPTTTPAINPTGAPSVADEANANGTNASKANANETSVGEANANKANAGEADANEASANKANANEASARAPRPKAAREFARGILLAVSSPSSILWFAAVGGALIAKSGATRADTATFFLGGFFLGGFAWTLFLCGLASHGRKRAGAGLLRACHALSALLFAYFSYSVIVHGYRDLIVHGANMASATG